MDRGREIVGDGLVLDRGNQLLYEQRVPLAVAKEQAGKLLVTLHLSCDINDALLVVSGTQRPASGGREVDTRVYEVACGGKMGYLLEAQGTATPIAISCLAADKRGLPTSRPGRVR